MIRIPRSGSQLRLKIDESTIEKDHFRLCWPNILLLSYSHVAVVYCLSMLSFHWYTVLFNIIIYYWAAYATTAGLHRLWAHKSYKAKWPLRLFLAIGHGFAYQFSLYKWIWIHRVHHKYTDTDADPHNSKRGFFFTQIGWFMCYHHEEVFMKRETIDLSDVENDWMIRWQHKLYLIIGPFSCFILPTLVPYLCWGEGLNESWHLCNLRFLCLLHVGNSVNSFAHLWGSRPYDKNISPRQNRFIAFIAFGEGWHNYHHVFPWDYRAAERGSIFFNQTTAFLHFCAKLGLAYDFKVPNPELVKSRMLRTGDGEDDHGNQIWGLEDKDTDDQIKKMVNVIDPNQKTKEKIF